MVVVEDAVASVEALEDHMAVRVVASEAASVVVAVAVASLRIRVMLVTSSDVPTVQVCSLSSTRRHGPGPCVWRDAVSDCLLSPFQWRFHCLGLLCTNLWSCLFRYVYGTLGLGKSKMKMDFDIWYHHDEDLICEVVVTCQIWNAALCIR